ncbi:N-acetyltransferase [Glycomyces sp. NRRL B-16210]|uniref:GNAT family N-acetyltransferase n=1 Tax=Glycomyces sp. NRRL B-16210 TaxID=1463821 RepID=UPI0004C1C5D6|nr:GNAT family N-acetyltransferase [Glycomyces sp. NRRL B-16210]
MPMLSAVELRGLQERAARAQPVEHVAIVDGWWLRRTAGDSWWLASVLPHGEAADLLARVEWAEEAYAVQGASVCFQISPGVCPAGLDELLDARGYTAFSRTSLQIAATAEVAAMKAAALESRVEDRMTREWFDVWHRVSGHGDSEADRAELRRLALPAAFASITVEGRTIAVGRAVADTGWTGVFGLATLPEARGRDAGRELLRLLAVWAESQGTAGMYLQVQAANAGAIALYGRAGFVEALGYHYQAVW